MNGGLIMFNQDVANICLQTKGFASRLRRAVTILKLNKTHTAIDNEMYNHLESVEENWLLRSGVLSKPILESDFDQVLEWLRQNAI